MSAPSALANRDICSANGIDLLIETPSNGLFPITEFARGPPNYIGACSVMWLPHPYNVALTKIGKLKPEEVDIKYNFFNYLVPMINMLI